MRVAHGVARWEGRKAVRGSSDARFIGRPWMFGISEAKGRVSERDTISSIVLIKRKC